MNDWSIDKDRNYYYNAFLPAVKSLADKEKQNEAWNCGNYEKFSDFSEIYISFSDTSEYVLNSYQHFLLVETQKEKLQKLYDMVENYDNTIDELDDSGWRKKKTDKQIYNDPKWHDIQRYAQEVYDELKNIKINT